MADRDRRNVPWFPDLPPRKRKEFERIGTASGLMGEPEDPPEVRKKTVAEWREWGRKELVQKGIDAELNRMHPDIREILQQKKQTPKVWNEKTALAESLGRIAEYEFEIGNVALARKMMQGLESGED